MKRSAKQTLLALTLLGWAACGGSSNGTNGSDALGTGGVIGGGGSGGSPGSGSAATDASASGGSPGGGSAGSGGSMGGGSGGSSGGYGGNGGTPSVCSDPMYPVSCPARGDVPAICWSAGTDCSTVTKCGNDFRSCNSPNTVFDCSTNSCVSSTAAGDGGAVAACSGTGYPKPCPAKDDVPALCWTPNTVCSTISRCNNEFKSCEAAGYHFSCTEYKCVPDSTTPAMDAAASADAGVVDASTPDASSDSHD